jgi:hypothetical protein
MRTFVIILICVGVVCSCASTKTVKTEIYGDRRLKIVLQKTIDSDGIPVVKGCSHPIQFDMTELKYLLRSIEYQEKGLFGWSDAKRVFKAEELYRMAPHLVEAFARATPEEEIAFASTAARAGTIFSSERYTDGRMFVKDKKLNCLFANIDIKVQTTDKYEGDPRKEYAGALVKLQADKWQRLVEGPKGTHYNWIEIDYETMLVAKREMERRAKARLERIRTIRKKQEFRQSGWEDWKPGEAVEEKPSIEDEVVWPDE